MVPSNRWHSVELLPDMVRVCLSPRPKASALPLKRPPLTKSISRSPMPVSAPRSQSRRHPRKKSPVQIQRWRERGARGVLRLLAARWKLIQLRRQSRLRLPPPCALPSIFGSSLVQRPPSTTSPFSSSPNPFSLESVDCLTPAPSASPAYIFSASPTASSVSTTRAPSSSSPSTPSKRPRPSSVPLLHGYDARPPHTRRRSCSRTLTHTLSLPGPLDALALCHLRAVCTPGPPRPCSFRKGRCPPWPRLSASDDASPRPRARSPPPPSSDVFFSFPAMMTPYTFL